MAERVNLGYVWKSDDGQLALVRCPKCSRENYIMNVLSGQCTWCGYKAKEEDVREEPTDQAEN